MKYAEKTKVPEGQTRSEIEKTLQRYGATGFMYGWHENKAVVAFEMNSRRIKFILPLPHENENENVRAQKTRQCWRALLLCIKSKLESVESDIETFEEAFLPHIVLPDRKILYGK